MALTHHKIIGTVAYMGGIMSVPEPFCHSWGQLVQFTPEALCQPNEHIHFDRTKLSLHDFARNDLLMRMKGDWILMLDTDIEFAPDLAARMVATFTRYNLDVLTAVYSFKKPPHFPVLYMYNEETKQHEIVAKWDREQELIQIDSAGAGALLVRRSVFESITSKCKVNPFSRIGDRGEDHSFFTRCRELGIKAFCAPHIEVKHLEYYGIQTSLDYVAPEKTDREYSVEALELARV